jgi:hypothetical protein
VLAVPKLLYPMVLKLKSKDPGAWLKMASESKRQSKEVYNNFIAIILAIKLEKILKLKVQEK